MKDYFTRHQNHITVILFFIAGGLLYLLFAKQTLYYDDDWYSMYAARVAGPEIFYQFYALDSRPVRALIMIPLYLLFKGDPFYYAISAYVFRVLGALTMLWTLRLVWADYKKETFLTAFLFLIYPGFLSQPVAVDFQSHLIGIWMAYLSIGLSIKSIFVAHRLNKILLWIGALLSGWLYLGLMEYYIGFEITRLILIAVVMLRGKAHWKLSITPILSVWFPYIIIPVVFFVWRLFIFEGQRKVTDVGLQLGSLLSVPLNTILTWFVYFLQDIANVTVLAWGVPLYQLSFALRLRDSLIAIGLAFIILLLFYLIFYFIKWDKPESRQPINFSKEAIWAGAAWVLTGLIFVILANRHITFPEYSRYGFVSAGGAVLLLVALLSYINHQRIQIVILGFLIISATITNYGNYIRFNNLASDIRGFWWQVSWRVPHFEAGTTIIAHYPRGGIRETSFVWGPANQIYFPQGVSSNPIQTGIATMLMNRDTVTKILNQANQFSDLYYLVETYPDPKHIIILSQPSPNSCLQVIDGASPEYSSFEDSAIQLIGTYSRPEQIILDENFRNVPEYLFGTEPIHDWCYYYQKASLARQIGDWPTVLQLARETSKQGLRPDDLIEWMPFLQAYALDGDKDKLVSLSAAIRSDKFVSNQVCQKLKSMPGLKEEIISVVDSKYCKP